MKVYPFGAPDAIDVTGAWIELVTRIAEGKEER